MVMRRRLQLYGESPESPRAAELEATFGHFHRNHKWDHTHDNNRCIVALAPAVAGALSQSSSKGLHPRYFLTAIDSRPGALRVAHVENRPKQPTPSGGGAAKRLRTTPVRRFT
jgi:hypothetical protein